MDFDVVDGDARVVQRPNDRRCQAGATANRRAQAAPVVAHVHVAVGERTKRECGPGNYWCYEARYSPE